MSHKLLALEVLNEKWTCLYFKFQNIRVWQPVHNRVKYLDFKSSYRANNHLTSGSSEILCNIIVYVVELAMFPQFLQELWLLHVI